MSETVYINRDNVVDLLLSVDGVAQPLDSVTQIDLKLGDITVSNTLSTEWPIKWLGLGTDGKIQIKLGDELSENYRGRMWVIVYGLDNLDGIVWGYVDAVVTSV